MQLSDSAARKFCHPELDSGSIHANGYPLREESTLIDSEFRQNDCNVFPRSMAEGVRRTGEGKKAAFTLAEVLITLGIIGVVAAMTIPNLITAHQKRVTVTKLQKLFLF